MSRRYLQELIKNLQEYYQCPSCSTNYYFDDIKLLGQIEVYYFVQLSCHSCSLPVIATMSIGSKKRRRSKSDLGRVEEAKFTQLGPISSDEIAQFHRYISGRRGGFKRLA